MTELSSLLPVVVAVALLGFSVWVERKNLKQASPQAKWNDFVR